MSQSLIVEAFNQNDLTSLLLQHNGMVYRPEADGGGINLILLDRNSKRHFLYKTQLKSRWTTDQKYLNDPELYIAFPDKKQWWLVNHQPSVNRLAYTIQSIDPSL